MILVLLLQVHQANNPLSCQHYHLVALRVHHLQLHLVQVQLRAQAINQLIHQITAPLTCPVLFRMDHQAVLPLPTTFEMSSSKSTKEQMHLAELYLMRSFELWISWGAFAVATSLVDRHSYTFNSESVRNSIALSVKGSMSSGCSTSARVACAVGPNSMLDSPPNSKSSI